MPHDSMGMIALLVSGAGLAIWFGRGRKRGEDSALLPADTQVSLAIKNLAATAGGIYLALIMLVSFLKLDVPEKANLYGLVLDPLAALAIILAVVQPVLLKLFYKK